MPSADPFVDGIHALLTVNSQCVFSKWMGTLTAERAEVLGQALATDSRILPTSTLLGFLRSQGCDVGKTVVNEHRSGRCTCAR